MKDADAVYQWATAAGTEIVEDIGDKPYGGGGSSAVTSKGKSFTSGHTIHGRRNRAEKSVGWHL